MGLIGLSITSQGLIDGMVGIKVIVGGGGVGANQVVVVVFGHLAGEHILAGQLIPTVAHKPLLIAVIDHWLAAGEEHQGVGQLGAGQQFVIRRARVIPLQEEADAPHVVVADKGGHGVGVAVGVGIVVVTLEEIAQTLRSPTLGGKVPGGQLEGKVDGGL